MIFFIMLRELRIKNFAIVDSLSITFDEGLNAVTGETGAGKSLIVNALELILGGRASSEFIKVGAEDAWVEAFFDIKSSSLLDSLNIPCDEGTIVKRVLSRNGKSRAYINDSFVTAQTLFTFSKDLVDLHGQHEHQSLLSPAVQMGVIDSFGRLEGPLKEVKELYSRFQTLNKTTIDIKKKGRERAQRIDLLEYQINEIESASLQHGEKDNLNKEKAVLANLTRLKYLSESAFNFLKDKEDSAIDSLKKVVMDVKDINSIDSSSQVILNLLQEAEAILQDAAHSLREIKEKYDCDPRRLDDVESRLAHIEKLGKKYGEGIEGILNYRDKAIEELKKLRGLEDRFEGLEKELKNIHHKLIEKSDALSRERKITAKKTEHATKEILLDLAFSHPNFTVNITETPLSSTGTDKVEFLFSANPGQPSRPLNKIISGGELSRVMLALKSIFANVDQIPILVFDEIDAGVGGKTADSVGMKLKGLSNKHQVICITHLPQIASRATYHLFIKKEENDKEVSVAVFPLKDDERVKEIARMLSGTVTETSMKHAGELLQKA